MQDSCAEVTGPVLTIAHPVPQWRPLGIFNLIFKYNGKIEGFSSPSNFLFSIKLFFGKNRKRKSIGRKNEQYRRNERES